MKDAAHRIAGEGELIAYCGHAPSSDQDPALRFPNGFDPASHIFNTHRISEEATSKMRQRQA